MRTRSSSTARRVRWIAGSDRCAPIWRDCCARPGADQEARIVLVQHELLELVEVLDPDATRTSGQMRERL